MSWFACYSASTAPEAHLVKGFLEHRGVPCVLRGEGPSIYPTATLGQRVQVFVPEDWLAVARKLCDRRGARRQGRGAPVVALRPRSRLR